MTTAAELLQSYLDLPVTEKEKVDRAIRALPDPPQKYVGPLWMIVVSAFIVLLLGGAFLLYVQVRDGDPTDVLAPLVTAALGVLAGLLAPSPVANK